MAKTFHGRIEDTLDALVIFEACRQGVLPKLRRRLCAAEKGETRDLPYELESPRFPLTPCASSPSSSRAARRPTFAPEESLSLSSSSPPPPKIHHQSQNLIMPGSVFVFDEDETNICRWTDGRIWSPSRICGNFLVYHELYRKLPEQKCSTAWDKANVRDGRGLKDRALRKKVEQDGLIVLGSRKGTFVLKKDGLIKKTICVKGIRLPTLDNLLRASGADSPSKTGCREVNSVEGRVTGVSFMGMQHLVCYEQAGAMEGLYRPRDYVELREVSLSKTFIANQKFRDPVKVSPPPAGLKLIEPTDEYVSQTRIVEAKMPPKPTLPQTDSITRSTATTRRSSGLTIRLGRKHGSETKAAAILSHPYATRGQDRLLREVLEESQSLQSSRFKSQCASPLPVHVDQTNKFYEDTSPEVTRDIEGSGMLRNSPEPNNSQLHPKLLAKDQICESINQEHDDIIHRPTSQTFRNLERCKRYARVEEPDIRESTLSRALDQMRPLRRVDNDVVECSSSNLSSPATTTTNSIPLSSSLSVSPVAAARDEPGAIYNDPLSPTGSTSYSENMDMQKAAQALQRVSVMAYHPLRQCTATSNTAYRSPYYECFRDAPETSIHALLFESDPVSPSNYCPPLPDNAQDLRCSGDHMYGPPPSGPAYLEGCCSYSSSSAPREGYIHRWYSPCPLRPRGLVGDGYTIPGGYPVPYIPSHMITTGEENLGPRSSYSYSQVISSKPLEPPSVHHGYQSDSPEGYNLCANAEYQMTPQQVLQHRHHDGLQLQQIQEQELIMCQKCPRCESSDSGSVGTLHSTTISSTSMTSAAGKPMGRGTMSEEEHTDNVGSWMASIDFGDVKSEQKGIGAELVREQTTYADAVGSVQVTELAQTDDIVLRHAVGPVYDMDVVIASDGRYPKLTDWQLLSDSSKEPGYGEQLIGRTQSEPSLFDPKSSSKRQRRSSNEYLAPINYEDLKPPSTVVDGARDHRVATWDRIASASSDPWKPLKPVQIISHVHVTPRRLPTVTIENSQTADDDIGLDPSEYLLYSHHQSATFEVVQEDLASHDESPSAHLGSEDDPFYSDLRARGIGGRSCLAVHASSSPVEPSSATDEQDSVPHDGSANK